MTFLFAAIALTAGLMAAWSTQELSRVRAELAAARVPVAPASTDTVDTRNAAARESAGVNRVEQLGREAARRAEATGNVRLDSLEIRRLQRLGLENPVDDLRKSLVMHPELISYKSSEGGFQFFPEQSILMPGQWVCAYFEDGLQGGHLLLHYDVAPGGAITWKRLASNFPM